MNQIIKMAAAVLLAAIIYFIPDFGVPARILYLLPYLIIGWEVLSETVEGILHREKPDENFLMTVASLGAMALGDCVEAIAVLLFYELGELFEEFAEEKTRKSVTELMDIRPDYANLLREDGTSEAAAPETVPVGSVILIRPGEKVPLDGTVLSGESTLDTSALTGESRPRSVSAGSEVISGCVNLNGVLRVRTEKTAGQSTASRILELVENAAENKSKSERFITRFARVYTPAVCWSALAVAVLPPILLLLSGAAPEWLAWIYRGLTFLVISCPCALVISVPLTFFAAIGGAGSNGILVKGANYMETLSKLDTVVFDKTGTVTEGVFEVSEVRAASVSSEELLELAALAELHSAHPISRSLRRAVPVPLKEDRVRDSREDSGRGVISTVDGRQIAVGNLLLMEELGISVQPAEFPGTTVYCAVDGSYAGLIVISDRIRQGAAGAVAALKKTCRVAMLTGDSEQAAAPVAEALGISEYRAALLPEGKVLEVERLLGTASKGKALAFVGDGVNDAPVLSRADVGIAMGALGSDAAVEAADVVLMDDDPGKLVTAIEAAKKCMRLVYENIVFAIAVKLLCLAFAAAGVEGMWMAVFADVGVMVLCVLNALRARKLQ